MDTIQVYVLLMNVTYEVEMHKVGFPIPNWNEANVLVGLYDMVKPANMQVAEFYAIRAGEMHLFVPDKGWQEVG